MHIPGATYVWALWFYYTHTTVRHKDKRCYNMHSIIMAWTGLLWKSKGNGIKEWEKNRDENPLSLDDLPCDDDKTCVSFIPTDTQGKGNEIQPMYLNVLATITQGRRSIILLFICSGESDSTKYIREKHTIIIIIIFTNGGSSRSIVFSKSDPLHFAQIWGIKVSTMEKGRGAIWLSC